MGQVAVVGAQDRASRQVAARVAPSPGQEALQGFVEDGAAPGATVYTDDASAYESLRFDHGTVRHSLQEYVRGDVHTNGIESLWSMLQRTHRGTFHKLSPQHLERYVQEFAGRHTLRELDTLNQLQALCRGLEGPRLTSRALLRDNGRPSGALRVAGSGARRAPRLGGRISASPTRARKPWECWSSRAQHGAFRCGNRKLASD